MLGGNKVSNYIILKKELKENKWIFIVGLIVLVVSAAFNVFSYDIISKLINTTNQMDLPEIAKEQIRLIKDFPSFIWFGWFGKSYTQVAAVLAILLGMGSIAKEVSKDTIGFLLSKPFSRNKVLFEKYISGILLLTILTFGSAIVMYLMILASGHDISLIKLFLGSLNALGGVLIIYSLAVLFSTFFNDRLKAGLITGAITLASMIPSFFPDYADYNFFNYLRGDDIFFSKGYPWMSFTIFIVTTVFIYLLSWASFNKRQF